MTLHLRLVQLGSLALATIASLCPAVSSAATIRVTIDNGGVTGGTFVTPVFVGLHDGSFNLFDGGTAASNSLETLAELGDTAGVAADFSAAGFQGTTIASGGALGDPANPPLFAPGDSATGEITITTDSLNMNNRLLLATMVLPTNDWFLSSENEGSTNSGGFDLSGLQIGETRTFTLNRLYDAGTEEEDFANSPANPFFGIAPGDAGAGDLETDIADRVVRFAGTIGDPNFSTDFSGFANNPTNFNGSLSPITVRVTAVPEPTSVLAMGLLTAGGVVRHRRKKAAAKVAA